MPNILITMWGEERDRAVRFAKLALDVGVDERQVRISEQQGAMLVKVVEATLSDLELSGAQRARGRELVAHHLRALPSVKPTSSGDRAVTRAK